MEKVVRRNKAGVSWETVNTRTLLGMYRLILMPLWMSKRRCTILWRTVIATRFTQISLFIPFRTHQPSLPNNSPLYRPLLTLSRYSSRLYNLLYSFL